MIQPVQVGTLIAGKYRVDQILGIGGMGMVVAATHLELDQRVAIKFMLPESLTSDLATDRFLREARAVVKLRSEHVCRVLDVGRMETGAPYIVMEMLDGVDFAQLLRNRTALPVRDAVDYVLQALEGVAEAHANGIVHRDLKPANLFVTTHNDGSPLVKVLDFGISKSAAGVSVTRTGDTMGSPAYMAPEQMASTKNVDVRADIWALGVILFEAVTGRYPYEAETLPQLIMNVMQRDPDPLDTVRRDLPRGFGPAVMRCLRRAPQERYADVGELAAALAPYGSPTAAESAARIARVLRRILPVRATPMPPGAAPSPHGPVSPLPIHAISTMQASSAGLPGHASKSRAPIWIGAVVALLAIGGGVTFAVMQRGDSPETTQVASGPTAAEPAPTATAAPAAPTPTTASPTTTAATASPTPTPPSASPSPRPREPTVPAPREPTVPAATVRAPTVEAAAAPTAKVAPSRPTRPTKKLPAQKPTAVAKSSRLPDPFAPAPVTTPPAPVAPVVEEVIPEKLTPQMIAAVIARIRAKVTVCADDLEASGEVTTWVHVAPDGHVIDAVADADGVQALAKCVAGKLKAATFPKTKKGGAFNKTFAF